METLIIQVDCRPYLRKGGGPPQLGITVEDPSYQQRKLLKTVAKDYRSHDYHNLDDIQLDGNPQNGTDYVNPSKKYSAQLATLSKKYLTESTPTSSKPIQDGLQITQIQSGSIIHLLGQLKIGDIIVEVNGVNLQRPFTEAQKALKQFVVEHTSHGPLVLKVLRKPASSTSSIPSTTSSMMTVIDRHPNAIHDNKHSNLDSQSKTQRGPTNQQQVKSSIVVTQTKPIKQANSPTSPRTPSTSSKTSRHLVGALNTRRIGTRHKIRLRKGPNGFGIKIAERDNMHNTKNRPIYITAITTNGSAYQDGLLNEGDMLLEINGLDLHGKSQPEVTRMLKAVRVNEEVELVISRQEIVFDDQDAQQSEIDSSAQSKNDTNENEDSLIDLNAPDQDDSVFADNSNQEFEKRIDDILNKQTIDGPGKYIYDIPLNDTKSAGLGLYLKYPRRSSDHKDLGIWIEKVITGGAAWKDGRLQPNDQIMSINGISLMGLSNAEASETLTAAVCRGVGPEATPNTIRLNIHRRDPAVAAQILISTDNRIEHSDLIENNSDRVRTFEEGNTNSQESYHTAHDTTIQNRSTQSNPVNTSSGSSNHNSQCDSAMSPQTQASSSLKLSPYNERQNSSDKTNETTASAISQITDFTSVPMSEDVMTDQNQNRNTRDTIPKTVDQEAQRSGGSLEDNLSSSQSWDDESFDAALTGEEAFQRDGFGRQSISEKRHAQLNAKNTDTYKRNQKAREERERQRKLEELLERQHIDEKKAHDQHRRNQMMNHQYTAYVNRESQSGYNLKNAIDLSRPNDIHADAYREVAVDAPNQTISKSVSEHMNQNQQQHFANQVITNYNDEQSRVLNQKSVPNLYNHQSGIHADTNMIHINRCLKCGAYESSCLCHSISQQQHVKAMRSAYQVYGGISNPGFDHNIMRRSNSLESVQQGNTRQEMIVPRAGTVRVARNRKVNESFRAAVDRSYDGNTNDSSSRHDQSEVSSDHRNLGIGPSKFTNSIANSTASTANDEKFLIGKQRANGANSNQCAPHKKSTSLLTRFLKFGSMKKKKKNESNSNMIKELSEPKTNKIGNSTQYTREFDASSRSQSSKGGHSRTNSSQSHPNISSSHRPILMNKQTDQFITNGQLHNNNIKQLPVLPTNMMNGFDMHQQRVSMPMCHYQQSIMHNNPNTHYNMHQTQAMLAQPKQQYQYTSLGRPNGVNFPVNNHVTMPQQYSQLPMHQYQGQTLLSSPPLNPHHQQVLNQGPPLGNYPVGTLSESVYNHQMPYPTFAPRDSRHSFDTPIASNGCNLVANPPKQWQTQQLGPNGLWVTSSPTSENMQPSAQSIYGTLPPVVPQHRTQIARLPQMGLEGNCDLIYNNQAHGMMQPMINQLASAQPQQPAPMQPSHHMNGHSQHSQHYPTAGLSGAHNTANNHDMQPQHIYYYDF